jgi:hypothetical protein
LARFAAVHALDAPDGGLVAAVDLLEREADLAHRRALPRGRDRQLQQVALAGGRRVGERLEPSRERHLVALGAQLLQARDLRLAHGSVLDLEDLEGVLLLEHVLVDAHDDLAPRVDARLRACGGLLDAQLGQALLDGLRHAAQRFHLLDVCPGARGDVVREALHVVAAAPRVDDARGAALELQIQLRVARDAGAEVRGQRDGLVQRVGVQRLRVALRGGHGLDAGARHVVVDVLRGEAPAGGLAVRAQREALLALGLEALDDVGPEQARGPHLGDLHEEVGADGPEEREARRECVHPEARGDARAQVLEPVRQRVPELEVERRAGLLHVVARDADAVELGHLLGRVAEDVRDDPHAGRGRVDVRVADHELLEDVVLDGPGQLLGGHALFFTGHDEEREDGQHRAVHGHGHAHLIERDAVEQDAHVLDGVDGHAGHAHVARDARVVRVVATVRGEIERDAEALLAGREVAAVEGVALLRRGEARVLADGPGLLDVHGGVGPAHEGGDARHALEVGETRHVFGRVERLDRDALGRLEHLVGGAPGELPPRGRIGAARGTAGVVEGEGAEVRKGAHRATSSSLWSLARISSALAPA